MTEEQYKFKQKIKHDLNLENIAESNDDMFDWAITRS